MIIPVILAGGSGSRLWPLSRQHYPKQLLKLFGDKTMLSELGAPIVVCNVEHRFMVAEQLNEIGLSDSAIILEPLARNTAPALALAALHAREINPESMLLVLSADHMISNVEEFQRVVKVAEAAAVKNHLVTFGVHPTHPETGYGYIKTSQISSGVAEAFAVEQFVEKPDLQTAQSYLAAGCYYWNSGMFVFKTDVFLSELQAYSPEVVANADQARTWAVRDLDFIRVDKESFAQAPNISMR